jgi:hypothetical protein
MSAGPHPALADPAAWPSATAELLAELGFSLVNGDDPTEPGGANLLVALRPRPTLAHFDPEVARFWRFDGRRGSQAELTRTSRSPAAAAFSWGRIEIVDRLLVENQFIGFGGEVRVADTPDGTRLVQFHSPAPILRWAGHSQGVDAMTDEVGAFFGRLMAPIDFQEGAEALVGQAAPAALYAAFVQDAWRRFAATAPQREAEPELAAWARREGHRLERDMPAADAAGRALRIALGLRPAG